MTTKGKWTATRITACKGKEKISALTAYDYSTAKLVDEAGIQLILVGDSLGMTVLGYENTLPVTIDDMIHHSKAVVRGASKALVVGDMPFMSYQPSIELCMLNAGRFIKEARVDAVKIEGGGDRARMVKALVSNGIPVMGHIGLTPQSIKSMGGFKVQGRTAPEAEQLIEDALALEKAGIFALVLEACPPELAEVITAKISIPTIGIGAGPKCDGQILVLHDVIGMFDDFTPKFVKQYALLGEAMKTAFSEYKADVEKGDFPGPEHCYK